MVVRRRGEVSLERALSKLGIASRTIARVWILEGKVRVNGVVQRHPGFPVVPERARLEVEGVAVGKARPQTFLLHKPRGVVTTRSDEKGRPTVFSLIKEEVGHLGAVGRLDQATSGLLLLTNATQLAAWLTDPKNTVPRVYLVTVRGEVTPAKLELLLAGIRDAGELLKPDGLVLNKASGRESHLTVTLTEGKNRELRRMFSAIGHEVSRLKRVSYGGLTLGKLQPGEYRELTLEELQEAFPTVPRKIFDVS